MKTRTIILFLSFMALCATLSAQSNLHQYDFSSNKLKRFTAVTSQTNYTTEKGFGYDLGTNADMGRDNKPFYFSVKLPEGNYLVTLKLGDVKQATSSTVKAESRRLMLEGLKTAPGKYITTSFVVNIKDRLIGGGKEVGLKPRELSKLDWDDKLTLEFDGHTVIQTLTIAPVKDQVTIYLAGNSTVVNQEDEPWASWGQMIPRFFNPGVAFANHAESGLTLGSFLGSRRLDKIMSVIKPGDYLFIEFGHNDQKEKGANDGAWKSYTERLKLFVQETRKKGAIPVIVTSTSRRSFGPDGKIVNSLGDFPAAARKVAQDEKVALIDLNLMSAQLYEALGEEPSKKAFVHYPANSYPGQDKPLADNTHFNPYGAYELAKCIVQGIKDNQLGIQKFIVKGLPVFDPSQPDAAAEFKWQESPAKVTVKPDGN